MPPALSLRLLQILQHALGVDEYGQRGMNCGDLCQVCAAGDFHRNHFCAGPDDEPDCRELVGMGYMETFTRDWLPYYNCTVTAAGKTAMRAQSPKPPKLTRGQQQYRRFLRADTGESFREWLKRPKSMGVKL